MLADRYELITPLGRGTMGTVWRAYDRSLGREVAIKEIRQEPGLSEAQRAELRERMIREGRTAARISHPSVATVHDAILEDGSPWIIMELVQARSLEEVVEEEGPLPPRLVAEIGVDLLGALRAAHAQGVLHRDVKPGNVLITENGRVVLTDFGIAKAEGDTSLTQTGMVIGSPGYTAPERARGEHTGPESDLWSLGATLYFAVEGRPAYERGSVAETLAALMTENADPPVQAGPLRPVLAQLLEKDYTARPTPAQATAMLRAVADTPTGAEPPRSLASASSESPTAPAAPAAPAAAAAPEPPATPAASGAPESPAVPATPTAPERSAAPEPAPVPTAPAVLAAAEAPAAPAAPAPEALREDGSDAAPVSGNGGEPTADEEFDANRTVVIPRPKDGLRLPHAAEAPGLAVPPAAAPSAVPAWPAASAPGAPAAGAHPPGDVRSGAPATGTQPPGGARPGFPADDPAATPPQGFPVSREPGTLVAGRPGGPVRPPSHAAPQPARPAGGSPDDEVTEAGMLPGHPGHPGPGGPVPGPGPHPGHMPGPGPYPGPVPGAHPGPFPGRPPGLQGAWQQPGPPPGSEPGPAGGGFAPPSGLGTDLFAITGGQTAKPARPKNVRIGILVLLGVAAAALVIIVILVAAAFADTEPKGSAVPDSSSAVELRRHQDPSGFTVDVPAALKTAADGDDVVFSDSDDIRYIRVNTSAHRSDDVEKAVAAAEKAAAKAGTFPGYRRIGVTEVEPAPYPGARVADWEFTYVARGDTVHVLARFVSLPGAKDDHAVYWAVPEVSWEGQSGLREAVLTSFRITGQEDGGDA
ncbi:hypothetical protein Plo01_37350 [Planobispora longispora]|uniref:non-specific serine/threonine protein kinase n=1 Tax=Planobispora longispora TaxID=28887 RepID=A0A8J3RIY6_9ACTN|nr:hypothetical protein Plo01_37350 [Planobispora longispora]